MRLLRLEVCNLGPFPRAAFSFHDEDPTSDSAIDSATDSAIDSANVAPDAVPGAAPPAARAMTVIHGPGGVGKTTLLLAIAATRPGCLNTLQQRRLRSTEDAPVEAPAAVTDWALGQEDPERPHALRLATPGARVFADDQREVLRRREQALFDKVARDGGFAWAVLPAHRWFSRQAVALSVPSRVATQYDARQSALFDDAARADLTRDTKQMLAYAAVAAALNHDERRRPTGLRVLGAAMREVVDGLVRLAGYSYRGLDAASLEPQFGTAAGARTFDELPSQVRHLVAMGALGLRAMWLAAPERDPRDTEGLVAIDEIDLHQDLGVQGLLLPTLRELLPNVQWIVTTQSGAVAGSAATHEVLALRRIPEKDEVEVYSGSDARTH